MSSFNASFNRGTVISRPVAGIRGRYWLDDTVDPMILYYDNGSDWYPVEVNIDSFDLNFEGDNEGDLTFRHIITLNDSTTLIDPSTTAGDLIFRGASAQQRLPIGNNFDVLQVRNGQLAWIPIGGANLRNKWEIFADFESSGVLNPFFTSGAGTGATVGASSTDAANRVGIASAETGTTATGRAAIATSTSAILLGGGEVVFEAAINIPTLSDGTDTYIARFGLQDNAAAESTDGVYFEYDSGTSANWRIVTANSTTRTKTTTSTAVAAATWMRLKIVINAAGTLATFYINDVSIGTISTNIPTGAGRSTGVIMNIVKSLGSNNRTIRVDWVHVTYTFTSARV